MFAALRNLRLFGSAEKDRLAMDSTLFSLTSMVPPPDERRVDPRVLNMLPVAKLVCGDEQQLIRIRNISAGGLMAEVSYAPASGEAVTIEFMSDQKVAGMIAWIRDSRIGIRFDDEVDLRQLLSDRRRVSGQIRRPPRLAIDCPATIKVRGLYHRVQVRDISLGGIKCALNDWQCVDLPAEVTIESFRTVRGHVRWYKAQQAGIVFDKPLRFEELAAWLAKRVEIASLKSGAWEA